jgi:hypothetical protein
MSEIRKDRCDVCGEETSDRYAQKGWVHVEGALIVHAGRRPDGGANEAQVFRSNSALPIDFCSVQCFVKFLRGYKAKSKGKKS